MRRISLKCHRPLPVRGLAATSVAAATLLCGAGCAHAKKSSEPAAERANKGNVSVLYAGSLVNYMERQFGPTFKRATGYGFEGFGGGSNELAAQVKSGVRQGDVFISASSSADNELTGSKNGKWVSWFATFATSPLVLGYNPKTKFGKELKKGVPWDKVITEKGILVGRTDPKLDPKGKLTVEAVDNASKKLHSRALKRSLKSFPVYPETTLVGRLQSGQLDAAFFYSIEAHVAKFPSVALTHVHKYAQYTVTILRGATHRKGSEALVRFLLSSQRASSLRENGLRPVKPKFHGNAGAVPKKLRGTVGAR